jgi:hypothetical protein
MPTRVVIAAVAALAVPAWAGQTFSIGQCPVSNAANYFVTSTMACSPCNNAVNFRTTSGTTDFLGNSQSCTCSPGYATSSPTCDYSTLLGCAVDVCTSCSVAGLASSRLDPTACIPCNGTSTFNSGTGECSCFSGSTGNLALVESVAGGVSLGYKTCAQCPARTLVFAAAVGSRRPDLYACQACADPHATMAADGTCVCDAGYVTAGLAGYGSGIKCLLQSQAAPVLSQYPSSAASLVTFASIQVPRSVASRVLYEGTHLQRSLLPISSSCRRPVAL